MSGHPVDLLGDAYAAAVAAADPAAAVRAALPEPPRGELLVVGAGKATLAMARAVEAAYGERGVAVRGAIIVPHGTRARASDGPVLGGGAGIEVLEGAHPVPDAAAAAATERLLALVDGAGADDHVLVLVSGGGSALLGAPAGLALADLREVVDGLLRSGADVAAMNVVRRRRDRAAPGARRRGRRRRPRPGARV
ncbi:MAG: DUF4147 domain-containing protein, partial [Trueperaceae bacterium]|nr:DUF4147 domain-containing protein [Trueperaceae bacterium]